MKGRPLLALTILYGSKVIVADMTSTLILKRLSHGILEYRILPLLLGLVLQVILRSIAIPGCVECGREVLCPGGSVGRAQNAVFPFAVEPR